VDRPITIGRIQGCDIIVNDPAASRQHVQVEQRGETFYWKDLGSTNGTSINGTKMLEGILSNGDRIEIGNATVHFETEEVEDEPPPGGSGLSDSHFFAETRLGQDGTALIKPTPETKADALLQAVYTVMNAIASNYDPCMLLDRILDTSMKAIDAQRGAVFIADRKKGDAAPSLGPCPRCGRVHRIRDGRLEHIDASDIKISRSVAHRVLEKGESVLFEDTADLDEADGSASIMDLNLRSIICVPLRGKFGILGVLYVDSNRPSHQYSHEDMLLTTAVGNSAGLALENATMHQQILDKQRMDQEIEYAWTIQENFLVKEWPHDEPAFNVFGITQPARTVGGDFYDFVQPDPERIGLLIGDVSGKGVPASLTMAQLLAEFRVLAQTIESPVEILRKLNEDFVQRTTRGTFCTLCIITLDLASGALRCANAGHHPALRINAQEVAPFGEASGPPVGILPEGGWKESAESVTPGDTILLYTDGIVEASPSLLGGTRSTGETRPEFGIESLQAVSGKLHHETPQAIIESVLAEVRRFCAPGLPHDDCTMIAFKYMGNG